MIDKLLSNNGINIFEYSSCGQINQRDCLYVSVSGLDAVRSWEILRTTLSDYYPIIMPVHLNDGKIISSETNLIRKDMDTYQTIHLKNWFSERWGDYDFDNEADDAADFFEETDEHFPEPDNNLPECDFSTPLTIPYEILTGKPLKEIWIVAFPIANFYEIPVHIQYGGWNACPYPTEHAAIMKYWHQLYGAEVIGMTHDVIEMKIANPPKTYEAAFELAKEQMAYCDDIVFQGTMTVERLAKGLVSNAVWFFWWD